MATMNLHQAKDGSKTYRVRVRRKGQPIQTASFSSLKDARKWATMIEGQIVEGRHFPEKKPQHTLNELLERYTHDIMPKKTPETQRSQRPVVVFWSEKLGHKLLQDITKADIVALRNALAKTAAPATIQKYLVILSHALNTAIKEYEWLDTNVVNTVSRPPLPQGRMRFLSDEERTRLLQECRKSQNTYLYPLVIAALHTGLRRGALLGLTKDMVDTSTGTIYLEKTKNGTRHAVPLVGEALALVRQRCEDLKGQPKAFLFPHTGSIPWNSYRKSWERAVKRAHLKEFSFHSMRHACASYLVQAGVPIYIVGRILNHKNPGLMTYRYAHLQTDNLREALETLSQRLSS